MHFSKTRRAIAYNVQYNAGKNYVFGKNTDELIVSRWLRVYDEGAPQIQGTALFTFVRHLNTVRSQDH